MSYFSHPNHKLETHIKNMVAFDDGNDLFVKAVHFHDLGKVRNWFQEYIKSPDDYKGAKRTHSDISAIIWLLNNIKSDKLTKEDIFIFNAILSHHSRLKSFRAKEEENDLLSFFAKKVDIEAIDEIYQKEDIINCFKLKNINNEISEFRLFRLSNRKLKFSIEDYIKQKLLFSELILADKYEATFRNRPICNNRDYNLDKFFSYKKQHITPNQEKEKAKNIIIDNFEKHKGERIFLITAPTGIGKTFISLELSLRIKKMYNKSRIIYLLPFTTIIDQTYSWFNEIFPNQITKHHHKIEYLKESEYDFDKWKFLVESWNDNFIVSTFYQFFYALFSDKNGDNVKFQALKNSVVIMDEVQAIPFDMWKSFDFVLNELSKQLNIKFILMSATMPIFQGSEVSEKTNFFSSNNRYKFKYLDCEQKEIVRRIVENYKNDKSVVCVVDTVKSSKMIYRDVKKKLVKDVYCLNSSMLYDDRKRLISVLTENKNSNNVKNKILISTQVIEAGVDLDFDMAFREIAPLYAIVQTAGRVNREGKKDQGTIYIFDLKSRVYSPQLMVETENIFYKKLRERDIEEKEMLKFSEDFFDIMNNIKGDGGIKEDIENFDFDLISRKNRKAFEGDDSYKVSVAIGVDLKKEEFLFYDKIKGKNRFEIASLKKQFYRSISDKILNISIRRVEALNKPVLSEFFNLFYFSEKDSVYSPYTGFLFKEEFEEKDCFI